MTTAPARDIAVITRVRDIIAASEETGRHDQGHYVSMEMWATPNAMPMILIEAERIAAYALKPIPWDAGTLEDPELPVCSTSACLAGWLTVVGAPAGAKIRYSGAEIIADGQRWSMADYGRMMLDVDVALAEWLFDMGRERETILRVLDYIIANPYATDDNLWSIVPGRMVAS